MKEEWTTLTDEELLVRVREGRTKMRLAAEESDAIIAYAMTRIFQPRVADAANITRGALFLARERARVVEQLSRDEAV